MVKEINWKLNPLICRFNRWHIANGIVCYGLVLFGMLYIHWHKGGLLPNIRLRKVQLFKYRLPLKYYNC